MVGEAEELYTPEEKAGRGDRGLYGADFVMAGIEAPFLAHTTREKFGTVNLVNGHGLKVPNSGKYGQK